MHRSSRYQRYFYFSLILYISSTIYFMLLHNYLHFFFISLIIKILIEMRLVLSRALRFTFCVGIQKYGISSRIGGASVEGLYEIYEGKFQNKALQKMKVKIMKQNYGTSIITTPEECYKCIEQLKKVKNAVAWDTQTIDLDVKNQCPVGKGKIICASFFAGPEFDFGNGPKVFIDNFGKNAGLLNYFKEYMEDQNYKKIWHNYGFDRHVFYNHGINVRGFAGDTMHMARLYDASKSFGGYALSSLTKQYRAGIQQIVQMYIKGKRKQYNGKLQDTKISLTQQQKSEYQSYIKNLQKYKKIHSQTARLQKIKMEQLFRRKKILKSGEEGRTYQYPSTLTLHTKDQYIPKWINYSVMDSQSTFFLKEALSLALKNQKSKAYPGIENIWKIYEDYWLPFGELLTDMQREGFKININHMKTIEQQAIQKIQQKRKQFLQFIFSFQNDKNIDYFNPSSQAQMQQLLHAPFVVDKNFKAKESQNEDRELQQLKRQAEQQEDIRVVKREAITQLPKIKSFKVQNLDPSRGNMKLQMKIQGLGIPFIRLTHTGLPSVDQETLSALAGSPKKNGKYGKAYDFFKQQNNQDFGKKLCQALQNLIELRQIQTLLQTFIQPLQSYIDKNERIHCSLNINTQTGRLSSKKPNLQNQPALQKDVYKIRSAFTCQKGKKLIVADYGQLQLRVLAHLTNCKAMIKAFKEGGDFHSRTAIGMFDYIKKDIEQNKVLLEWDKSKGQPPVPLLKQKYAAERRKAKTVNFSIAYGKTAQGFAEDWNCSIQQAKQVIKSWFNDRIEVQKWQKQRQQIAKKQMYTQTLLGRYRKLDKFFSGGKSKKGSLVGMGLRRAINTPIQGGAADIVIASMVKIHKNQELKKLGWKLLLQIHDQLILEGPQQNVKRAFQIVKDSMSHPFEKELLIQLQIDAKIGETWYECK